MPVALLLAGCVSVSIVGARCDSVEVGIDELVLYASVQCPDTGESSPQPLENEP